MMMRKILRSSFCVLLSVMLALSLTGCGREQTSGDEQTSAEDVATTADNEETDLSTDVGLLEPGGAAWDVVSSQETDQGQTQQAEDQQQTPEEEASGKRDPAVDLDLTELSATMVYSEVYNMMTVPEDYIGKTIKMNGTYVYYKDETTGNEYFSCIIQDATACCSQGIEFILTDDYRYPDDYPAEGSQICVSGVFDTYDENGVKYCTLRNAKLV